MLFPMFAHSQSIYSNHNGCVYFSTTPYNPIKLNLICDRFSNRIEAFHVILPLFRICSHSQTLANYSIEPKILVLLRCDCSEAVKVSVLHNCAFDNQLKAIREKAYVAGGQIAFRYSLHFDYSCQNINGHNEEKEN